jgi:hypothetical protein
MARTSQKRTNRSERAKDVGGPVHLPELRKGTSRKSLVSRILRATGVFFLCVLVGGVAFAAGGYLGLIESVRKLDEPRTYETHPTYIYSAPLGGNEDSRRVIGTIFGRQNRKTASLSEMPPHLLDAWFIGFTPELVTGAWMGYAEGRQTLEYVLDYARKLHGLSGGITPAEIWKTYTKVILSDEPIEQFDGVKIPERADPAAAPRARVENDPDSARRRASASPGARVPVTEPRRVAAASASASSVSPSRARESRTKRAGAPRYSSASSSASAAPRSFSVARRHVRRRR